MLLLHGGLLDSPYNRVVLYLHAIRENLTRRIVGQVLQVVHFLTLVEDYMGWGEYLVYAIEWCYSCTLLLYSDSGGAFLAHGFTHTYVESRGAIPARDSGLPR